MKASTSPSKKPHTTCGSVCWRRIIRLVPTMPPKRRIRQNHHTGLKENSSENTKSAPATPPMAAVWVEIFHQTLIKAQTICTIRAAMTMLPMKWGIWNCSIR